MNFNYIAGFGDVANQTLTVPAGVSSIRVFLNGSQGGSTSVSGGLGGQVEGVLAVAPGDAITVRVGGEDSRGAVNGGIGNGGADFGNNGGGATDLLLGGNRVAIAGGGGGAGSMGWNNGVNFVDGGVGGAGGGGAGGAGAATVDTPNPPGPLGGEGGRVGFGGQPGMGCNNVAVGPSAGSDTGVGGTSPPAPGAPVMAGGGGGGGGGASMGGGGGGGGMGSFDCAVLDGNGGGGGGAGGTSDGGGLSSPVLRNGVHAGDGSALICYTQPTFAFSGSASGQSGAVTLRLDTTNPTATQQVTVAQGATSFAFPNPVPAGANWTLGIAATPAGQQCGVTPASGSAVGADVANLVLQCRNVSAGTVSIDPASLSDATQGVAFAQTLTASSSDGAIAPYAFALASGALPDGLALSAAGELSGTPSVAGRFDFSVQATSSNGISGSRAYSMLVNRSGTQSISQFVTDPAAPVFAAGGTFTVSAVGGASGNRLIFASLTPAVCTVSGNTVSMRAIGLCTLSADQAGGNGFEAAPQAQLSVMLGAIAPSLTWIEDLRKQLSEGGFDLPDPRSDSAGAFGFASADPGVATVSGRRVTLVGTGITTLTATQAASGGYLAATVSIALVVADRPDPTRDAGVVGGLQAQIDASTRFLAAQQTNLNDRLRQLRHAADNRSSHSLAFSLRGDGRASQGLRLAPDRERAAAFAPEMAQGWGLWSAGTVVAGGRDARGGSRGFDFRSDGVTFGADWRGGDALVLGLAAGFGWNDTDLDGPRSRLKGKQRSLALYGLWRGGQWFVDGNFGLGRLNFDTERWNSAAAAAARGERDGRQAFGALTTGYEYAGDKLHLTGYGRIDVNRTRLRAYAERGLDDLDLRYGAQTLRDRGLALGLEGQYATGASWHPYWMLEYRDGSNDRSDVALNYVQRASANDYVLGLRSYGDRSFTYGGGMDLDLSAAWRLSLLLRRQHASGQDAASTFGLLLSYSPGAARTIAMPATSPHDATDAAGHESAAQAGSGGGEDGR
ncbi:MULTISPECIES: autotransporter outer membrane beta-barrel domain-containing protein [Lysobacter]|uniref:autotransporter outer membrane beta-barrel domain-containing protein n=1 Tax=Lysobacter TaxID=68 RepID=UPI0022861D34|nr:MULTISPECIES: autotransporter outer membrane beta-barrel domain-containing protein [Lysobacter]